MEKQKVNNDCGCTDNDLCESHLGQSKGSCFGCEFLKKQTEKPKEKMSISTIKSKNEKALPVSVLINLLPQRKSFFYDFVLPLIRINCPNEIIINNDETPGSAARKWNESYDSSTQPYVLIWPDDVLMPEMALRKMYEILSSKPAKIGYAYVSEYWGIPLVPENHDAGIVFRQPSKEFDPIKLRKENITTLCLYRRENFIKFDENLNRLIDWEINLRNLFDYGTEGVRIEGTRCIAFYMDKGISSPGNSIEEARKYIFNKFGKKR